MNIAVGIPDLFSHFLLFVGGLLLLDFLLAAGSRRLSLASGRPQYFLLNRIGKSPWGNMLVSTGLRSFSFLEKAYFAQVRSLAFVSSFSLPQKFMIFCGGFLGGALLMTLFLLPLVYALGVLAVPILILALFSPRKWQDLGIGGLLLGSALVALWFFTKEFGAPSGTSSLFQIPWTLPLPGGLLLIFVSYLLFKTILPFLVGVSFFLFQSFIEPQQLVLVFFTLCLARSLALVDLKRLQLGRLTFFSFFWWGNVVLQPLLFFGLFQRNAPWVDQSLETWAGSLSVTLFSFLCFEACGVLISMVWYGLSPWLEPLASRRRKKEPQKILAVPMSGEIYSIHFLIYLLRQEFAKYTTMIHTTFKLGKEVGLSDEDAVYRFTKYCGILPKVAEELKALCFAIGRQRAYSRQLNEVFTCYQRVNHLELLVEDLGKVVGSLRQIEPEQAGFRKGVLRWFHYQLRVFEDFYFSTMNLDEDRIGALEESVRLDQVFASLEDLSVYFDKSSEDWTLLQTCHRMMDTNLGLREKARGN